MVIQVSNNKPEIPEPEYKKLASHDMTLYAISTLTSKLRTVRFTGTFCKVIKRDGTIDMFLESSITRSDCSHDCFKILNNQMLEDDVTGKQYYIDIINIDPVTNFFVFRISDVDNIPKAS